MPFRVTKPGSGTNLSGEAKDCLKEAVQAYEEGEGSLSISQAERLYVVSKTTLYNRINGRRDQASYGVTNQILNSKEEKSIENWVLEVQRWGFPPGIAQLRARGDYKVLGINWTYEFLNSPSNVIIKIQPYT